MVLRRIVSFFVGLLLLPCCVAATMSVSAVIQSLQAAHAGHLPPAFWGLVLGFLLWIFLFFSLPLPMRTYVLGHELTHALWAWLLGAEVSSLRVSGKGGSVKVSKSNVLITLAPYFFPFYTICVLLAYYGVSLFFDPSAYEPFWLGCIGLTWSFHLTFTVVMLRTHQPDIQHYGRLFSYSFIYLMNVLGICLWIVIVASPTLEQLVMQLRQDSLEVWSWTAGATVAGWNWTAAHIHQ
jgi:hypothetical protein